MTYYDPLSTVKSGKKAIRMRFPSESFFVQTTPVTPFIEPRLTKREYPIENPSIILVQAIAASGKTTTARALSYDTQLPILDLARHEAVGSKTLNGVLPDAYPHDKISEILTGFSSGSFGVIIDGIDEARFQVKEAGFEAFLNNLLGLSKGGNAPVIIVFGRSQVLLSVWYYLGLNGADVGLVEIRPFDLDHAKHYIDSQMNLGHGEHRIQYEIARDQVLNRLERAFRSARDASAASTLSSFIGYPPVLDAIATLLQHTPNYFSVTQALGAETADTIETDLLIQISNHLLERDRTKEAVTEFFSTMLEDHPQSDELRNTLYNTEEQCARIIAKTLKRAFPHRVIQDDDELSSIYEESVDTWCSVHPFLKGDEDTIRNSVFSAVAVMHCMFSRVPAYQQLARDYTNKFLPTYHLIHIVNRGASGRALEGQDFNMLIQSCSDHLGLDGEITIEIDGESWEEGQVGRASGADMTIELRLSDGVEPYTFRFKGTIGSRVSLGPYLINAQITLPCDIELSNSSAIEIIGDCSISARNVRFSTPELIVREIPHRDQLRGVNRTGFSVTASEIGGRADSVLLIGSGGFIDLRCRIHAIHSSLAQHVRIVPGLGRPDGDESFKEKYLRLRRILLTLRSHKRGGLARYKGKIEHRRVLPPEVSDVGTKVLTALRKSEILTLDGVLYRLDGARSDEVLGISWDQLRRYESTEKVKRVFSKI